MEVAASGTTNCSILKLANNCRHILILNLATIAEVLRY